MRWSTVTKQGRPGRRIVLHYNYGWSIMVRCSLCEDGGSGAPHRAQRRTRGC